MSHDELDRLLHVVTHQRPFRPYVIEFVSGGQVVVKHPEIVDRRGDVYVYLGAGGDYRLFAAASVSHLLPPPRP